MPEEFLGNLPKNLTTHLTHKLCAVLPELFSFSNKTADTRFRIGYPLFFSVF